MSRISQLTSNLLFLTLVVLISCQEKTSERSEVLMIVKRNYDIPKKSEKVMIPVDWKELVQRVPALKKSLPAVTDKNFGTEVPVKLIDTNNDETPDYLVLDHTLDSNEPIFTFLIKAKDVEQAISSESFAPDSRFEISFLTPLRDYEKQHGKISDLSSAIVTSTMNQYPDIKDFPIYSPNRWNYEYSFFLLGVFRQGKKLNNTDFISYAWQWLDNFITDKGGFKPGVYEMDEYKLDDILPGRLVLSFYEETDQPKYKYIADTLILHLTKQPKTSDGGYWHKEIYPYQMWLDGIFMADVFSMQYAKVFNQPEWFDEAVKQIKLMHAHAYDSTTGLLYHGWDESKNPVWAHPVKGTSPEFWGRAIGWYIMALVESLEYLPEDHPERKDIVTILQQLASAVRNYQDPQTGLWYQVLDKGSQPGNWIETSCSAMFAYAFSKGHRQGFLDESFLQSANKAFDAILDHYMFVDDSGNLHLDQTVKIGTLNPETSKGDYEYYITTERRIDDYKGLAALLFASVEMGR